MFSRLHHVAYRCKDAQRTVEFYTKVLGLKYVAGLLPPEGRSPSWPLLKEGQKPSTVFAEPNDSLHIFFELGDGSYLAFFDVDAPPEPEDTTPWWVKHIAFEVPGMEFMLAAKRRLEEHGVEVLGPKDHHICQSIYFYDPDGHRLEMAVRTEVPGMWDQMEKEAPAKLAEWNKRKKQWKSDVLPPPVTAGMPAGQVRVKENA